MPPRFWGAIRESHKWPRCRCGAVQSYPPLPSVGPNHRRNFRIPRYRAFRHYQGDSRSDLWLFIAIWTVVAIIVALLCAAIGWFMCGTSGTIADRAPESVTAAIEEGSLICRASTIRNPAGISESTGQVMVRVPICVPTQATQRTCTEPTHPIFRLSPYRDILGETKSNAEEVNTLTFNP